MIVTFEHRLLGADGLVHEVGDADVVETPARIQRLPMEQSVLLLFHELGAEDLGIQWSHDEAHVDLVGIALGVVVVEALLPLLPLHVLGVHAVGLALVVLRRVLALIRLTVFCLFQGHSCLHRLG